MMVFVAASSLARELTLLGGWACPPALYDGEEWGWACPPALYDGEEWGWACPPALYDGKEWGWACLHLHCMMERIGGGRVCGSMYKV